MNWFLVFRLFRKAPDARRPSARRCPAAFRPRLEALEDRCVPSTLVVTSPLDNANVQGTLRYDIANAQSGDTILISPALRGSPIVLTQGELFLNKDLTIEGLPQAPETISSGGNSRVFEVAAGTQVTLKDLNITAGRSSEGGGILNSGNLTVSDSTLSGNTAGMSGGAVLNFGNLTVSDSTLSGNTAGMSGGGIFNFGSLTISNSTLSDNSADHGTGGGILNLGSLTISDSILSDNSATGAGGGIYNSGSATVSDSTLSENTAGFDGGGIYNLNSLTVSNTDFCHNHPNDISGAYTDGGGNTHC